MITSISGIAAIAGKIFGDLSDHIETTLQRSKRSFENHYPAIVKTGQRNDRSTFLEEIVAIVAII